jgi:hypothetical protein
VLTDKPSGVISAGVPARGELSRAPLARLSGRQPVRQCESGGSPLLAALLITWIA